MSESSRSEVKSKNRKFLFLGLLLLGIYAVFSNLAMNDLWKFYVDQQFEPLFEGIDPLRHRNSGMQFMYISLAALAGSMIFLFKYVRRMNSMHVMRYTIITGFLLIIGLYYMLTGKSVDMRFQDYIDANFYPFWAFTLAGLFAVCGVASFLNKK